MHIICTLNIVLRQQIILTGLLSSYTIIAASSQIFMTPHVKYSLEDCALLIKRLASHNTGQYQLLSGPRYANIKCMICCPDFPITSCLQNIPSGYTSFGATYSTSNFTRSCSANRNLNMSDFGCQFQPA